MTIKTVYEGELRTKAMHLKSGEIIITDAPPDNHGKGEAFSPTDLLCASLGSCMLTIAGIAARTHGFNIDNTQLNITKIMANDPRRVAEVICEFRFPHNQYSLKEKLIIERSIHSCPVSKSLHADLKQTVIIHFTE
ncbi:MAG: OsmC family protein [Bacteroidetes bacterium]|nr:OsmC family protein [Bacteroidota bacterium]